jgi:putative membrane protein insertion efficiency factor
MKWLLLTLIRGYQRVISRYMPPVCRFYPSCSRYTYQAITHWGVARGSWMGVKRICRCHPFHPGGLDPVPLPPGVIEGPQSARPEHL